MATTPLADGEWRPRFNPWLIAVSVMLGTFMEVLDTSVANVSLPHIGGALSATPEEATWVLTSYLVSNAIILPTTAWLSSAFGRKRFLLTCIALFTVSSAVCGAATSLSMLIVARVLQGVGGGALGRRGPLMESFPPARRRGDGDVLDGRHRRTDPGTHPRRLDHRSVLLALDLLH